MDYKAFSIASKSGIASREFNSLTVDSVRFNPVDSSAVISQSMNRPD
jgi:hypothetical protein